MAGTRPQRGQDTSTRILDVAERLVQVRGFNGFSYADVAGELNITKASLHYHFAGKAELGEALIAAVRGPFRRGAGRDREQPHRCTGQARRLREALRRRAPRQADVPVRDARGRIPDAPQADAERRDQVLRRERGVARGRPGPGTRRGNLEFAGSAERRRSDDRQRARGCHARVASLRRPRPIPGDGGPTVREPHELVLRDGARRVSLNSAQNFP